MPIPSTPVPSVRKTMKERVEDQLRMAILDGTLQPGEVLNDAELQEWLGVSRQPIREALNRLAYIGLVEMEPQRYTRVAVVDPQDRLAVLQTLGALFGGVIRVTVPSLAEEQRGSILTHLDRMLPLVAANDAEQHGKLGWELIDLFIEYCPNRILVRATRGALESLAFHLSATTTDENLAWESFADGYLDLRDAVAADEAVKAELAIEQVFQLASPTK